MATRDRAKNTLILIGAITLLLAIAAAIVVPIWVCLHFVFKFW